MMYHHHAHAHHHSAASAAGLPTVSSSGSISSRSSQVRKKTFCGIICLNILAIHIEIIVAISNVKTRIFCKKVKSEIQIYTIEYTQRGIKRFTTIESITLFVTIKP